MRTVHRAFLVFCTVACAVVAGSQPPTEPSAPPEAPALPAKDEPKPAGEAPPDAPAAPDANPGELREAIVLLRDGQRYKGLLVSRDNDKVVLKISGIDTSIPTSQIDRVSVLAPVMEQYRAMRATIDDNDVERLLMLAEWLRSRSQWDAALTEIDQILKQQPDYFEAKKLRTLVLSQKRLAEAASRPKGPHAPPVPAAAEAQPPTFPLLSEHDINLIRVYEVDLQDPPRMMVERRTIAKLLAEHNGDPAMPATPAGREALYRMSPARVLELMFQVRARDLYGQVQVLEHPRSMRLFRDEVHRSWLINSCATTRCHGGPDAGRLMLYNQRSGTDAALYTNFLILDRFRLADGRPLINYEEPANSPLLQLGLPRQGSLAPHPIVPAFEGNGDVWRPFFRSPEDRRFQGAVEWIKSMYRPRPEYPIEYTPPRPAAAKPAAPPVER